MMVSSIREILLQICTREGSDSVKPHAASLLNSISKQLETNNQDGWGISLVDLLTCLKIPLINDNKVVRAAGLRVIRLCLHNEEAVRILIQSKLDHFIAKCLDVTVDNMAERVQALRLCRRILLVNPDSFPATLGRCVVALALDGTKEKDRLVRASFALLAELCVLNPTVFISSGGIHCFSVSILDCPSPRMQEAMIAALLYLLDVDTRRKISGLNLRFLIAPYSDYHYKHNIDVRETNNTNSTGSSNEDRELRLTCAKQALLSVLRSWPGLLHVISCNIFEDLIQVLVPCHMETRKAMLEFFYTLLRLPLPDWTDELSVALLAINPSRFQDAWKLQEGYVAMEGKALLPHVSKFRPNLVLNHMALLVYCLIEAGLIHTLIQVIITSDSFISLRATLLLGEVLHLSGTLLPPVCHGTKVCLPTLVDCITSLKSDSLQRHRAAQAAAALAKIHQLKKKSVTPQSLALKQLVLLERRRIRCPIDTDIQRETSVNDASISADAATAFNIELDDLSKSTQMSLTVNGQSDGELQLRPGRDTDSTMVLLLRDSSVLTQKDPLLWNWHALSNVLLWTKMNASGLSEDSTLRSVIRRLIQFYKPGSNQFCQCEISSQRTRLYSIVGCLLMDFLTSVQEIECEKMLSELLEDVSGVIRNISLASSAHDCLLSPGRLSTTACQDYFLLIGRLSASSNGTAALERAGIFQDLLELVTTTNHDCYFKVVVSNLNYHSDGYARAILKKVLKGAVDSGRIYSTHHLRVLLRAAVAENSGPAAAKWVVPLLLNQLKDHCRAVVMSAADILDEATDVLACLEALLPLQSKLRQVIEQQQSQHLGLRGRLLLIKTLSIPAGFKLWTQAATPDPETLTLLKEELDRWIDHFNVRYVQIVESDLADGLTHHQRADDGRYGRLSNSRHAIRELPVPAHLFSQLSQHREGLDFLRMSGHLSTIFSRVTSGSSETDEEILDLKAAIWAAGHLGMSEVGVALLESAQVVEGIIRLANSSSVLALRGTAFFALNLIATTSAGVQLLSQFGWASIQRHHGDIWSIVDDSEWNYGNHGRVKETANKSTMTPTGAREAIAIGRERIRSTSQSSSYSVTFAGDLRGPTKSMATSTPLQPTGSTATTAPGTGSWDTESQAISLEGSSIHFESDSDLELEVDQRLNGAEKDAATTDRCRRAYTLPPNIHPSPDQHVTHFRSFSDSHYPCTAENGGQEPSEASGLTSAHVNPRRASAETRIWDKLRSSLRLRRPKRFSLSVRSSSTKGERSLPISSPASLVLHRPTEATSLPASIYPSTAIGSTNVQDANSDEISNGDDLECDSEEPFSDDVLPLLRSTSTKNQKISSIKSRGAGSRDSSRRWVTPAFIGLCLPARLSSFYPPKDFFDARPKTPLTPTLTVPNWLGDDTQFEHDIEQCLVCSHADPGIPVSRPMASLLVQSDEERLLVRKELLRLVFNMGCSVGLGANEQGLLRLKQRFPWAFHDVCLFSDICHVLANYGYRLRARRFLHELFMDLPFQQFLADAVQRLSVSAS